MNTRQFIEKHGINEVVEILNQFELSANNTLSYHLGISRDLRVFKNDPVQDHEDFKLRYEVISAYVQKYKCLPKKTLGIGVYHEHALYAMQLLYNNWDDFVKQFHASSEKVSFMVKTELFDGLVETEKFLQKVEYNLVHGKADHSNKASVKFQVGKHTRTFIEEFRGNKNLHLKLIKEFEDSDCSDVAFGVYLMERGYISDSLNLFKDEPVSDMEDFRLRFEFMLGYRREYDCLPLKILHIDTNCYMQYFTFPYVQRHLHSLPEKEKINFLVYTGLFLEEDAEKFAKEYFVTTKVEPVNPWNLDLEVSDQIVNSPDKEVKQLLLKHMIMSGITLENSNSKMAHTKDYFPVYPINSAPEDTENIWIIGIHKGSLYAQADDTAYLIDSTEVREFIVFEGCGQKAVNFNICRIDKDLYVNLWRIAEDCMDSYYSLIPNLKFTDDDVEDFLLSYESSQTDFLKRVSLYHQIKKIRSISERFRRWAEC